jgi:hypothetical protein
MNVKTLFGALALTGFAVFSAPAMAATGDCTGSAHGTSKVTDVFLDGAASDGCIVAHFNPQGQGIGSEFGGGWTTVAKLTTASSGHPAVTEDIFTFGSGANAVKYTVDYTKDATTKAGTFTVKVDKAVTVDLVLAIHAGANNGAFFFDDQILSKTPVNAGTWQIKWVNGGGNIAALSNITLFARNQTVTTTPVPEPETYAMLLGGLGLIGFAARRRRNS